MPFYGSGLGLLPKELEEGYDKYQEYRDTYQEYKGQYDEAREMISSASGSADQINGGSSSPYAGYTPTWENTVMSRRSYHSLAVRDLRQWRVSEDARSVGAQDAVGYRLISAIEQVANTRWPYAGRGGTRMVAELRAQVIEFYPPPRNKPLPTCRFPDVLRYENSHPAGLPWPGREWGGLGVDQKEAWVRENRPELVHKIPLICDDRLAYILTTHYIDDATPSSRDHRRRYQQRAREYAQGWHKKYKQYMNAQFLAPQDPVQKVRDMQVRQDLLNPQAQLDRFLQARAQRSSDQQPPDQQPPAEQKKGMSTGTLVALGAAGAVALVLVSRNRK